VSFSGGFHPLPRLQLALPLPLGVEGEAEWFDLEFTAPLDPEVARQVLSAVLPAEFRLLSATEVPVAAPSLSQELEATLWRFTLRPRPAGSGSIGADRSGLEGSVLEAHPPLGSGAVPDFDAWRRAIGALLTADSLTWRDQDKKGRPRARDCRPYLLDLRLTAFPADPGGPGARAEAGEGAVELALEAAIDPQGRSLRPEQVAHWLVEQLGCPLQLQGVRRQQLRLRAC
jgi:hypothetical protein